MTSINVGDIRVTCLPDGSAELDGYPYQEKTDDGELVDWGLYHELFPNDFHGELHQWRIHNNCFLVEASNKLILMDTGVGEGPYPRYKNMKGGLQDALQSFEIANDDIDFVFMTHAHPDHVAWNLNSDGSPRFANAEYILHKNDWEEFTNRDPVPPFFGRFIEPLRELGVMRLVEGDYEITSGVEIFETPGHTPGHMSARIHSKKESLLVVGDVLVNPFYVSESGRAFQSDKDPVLGIKTRQTLLAQAVADQSLLASAHFSEPGVGSIEDQEDKLKFIPR